MLENAEFDVVAAADGPQALKLVQNDLELIDCAVIDLTMPGMGGVEVAGAIRELKPGLPIILMSGYAPAVGALGQADDQTLDFLQKPFTADALVDSVRAALDK
jgi:DNA-binding NtrC family response regulator